MHHRLRSRWVAVLCTVMFCSAPVIAIATPLTEPIAAQSRTYSYELNAGPSSGGAISAYTLSPDRDKEARDLARIGFRLRLIGFAYSLLAILIILRAGLAPNFRTWAEKASPSLFLQAVIFVPLLFFTLAVLYLPLNIYSHWLYRTYGLFVQGWSSWLADWAKNQLISYVTSIIMVFIFYAVVRRSAHRWWIYFWLVSLPILVFISFLRPWVVDPMFDKFEPLAQKDPELVIALQRMAENVGQSIPPDRMFWKGAGKKTNQLNAFVTGFGASERIVIWDTTIAKMSTPQIVSVAAHEMGHYVLNHIFKWLVISELTLFAALYFLYRCVGFLLGRYGAAWHIRGLDDLASLPILMLLYYVFAFATNPIINGVNRHFEHQADQYSLEITHSLIQDSGQVAAQAHQIIGQVNLDDPSPSRIDVFLFYDHPPISNRIQFDLHYDPWSKGEQPEFVKDRKR